MRVKFIMVLVFAITSTLTTMGETRLESLKTKFSHASLASSDIVSHYTGRYIKLHWVEANDMVESDEKTSRWYAKLKVDALTDDETLTVWTDDGVKTFELDSHYYWVDDNSSIEFRYNSELGFVKYSINDVDRWAYFKLKKSNPFLFWRWW